MHRQKFCCIGHFCGGAVPFPSVLVVQLDHRTPLFMGGNDSLENLDALCANCHDYKSRKERERHAICSITDEQPTTSFEIQPAEDNEDEEDYELNLERLDRFYFAKKRFMDAAGTLRIQRYIDRVRGRICKGSLMSHRVEQ